MLYGKDDRVPRAEWLKEFGFKDRQEKRARALGLRWPPYVVVGCRVLYSRQRTQEWFAEHEAKSGVGGETQ